jgi:hypothetical protein
MRSLARASNDSSVESTANVGPPLKEESLLVLRYKYSRNSKVHALSEHQLGFLETPDVGAIAMARRLFGQELPNSV